MAAPTPQQQQSRRDRQIIVALTAAFTTGVGGGALIATVANELERLGLDGYMATWLAHMAGEPIHGPELKVLQGPAQRAEYPIAAAWRGLYLVNAAERLQHASEEGGDALTKAQEAEQRYYASHLMAEERRFRSAALVDAAAHTLADRTETPGLLGWRSVMDARTTPECAMADGRNFPADKRPVIGWPGSVHLRCRCTVGPALPGAPLLPSD